jgi:hypothetical protein
MVKVHGSQTSLMVRPGSSPEPLSDAAHDVERSLELVASRCAELEAHAGGLQIELYHRSSCAVRAARRADSDGVLLHRGRDEGSALRVRAGDGAAMGFYATSGSSSARLREGLARCREALTRAERSEADEWPSRDGAAALRDLESRPSCFPGPSEAADWLAEAWAGLAERARTSGLRPLEGWVEAASTIETWGTGEGWSACRTRLRGWAGVRLLREQASAGIGRPMIVARRRWADLSPRAWVEMLEDRCVPTGDPDPVSESRSMVLFDPQASSALVVALERVLSADERQPVGPAWRLADAPQAPEAVSGGLFDDVGLPTARCVLADGEWTTCPGAGAGRFRRPSFRDRPTVMSTHLVVEGDREEAPPPSGLLVSGLTIHPLSRDVWVLLLDATLLDQGRPGRALAPAVIRIAPRELVRRCVATVGPARQAQAVSTAALLFDDLPIEAAAI